MPAPKTWDHEPCWWRPKARAHWRRGSAMRVMNDATGSVEVKDHKRGHYAHVPNDPAYIKERDR